MSGPNNKINWIHGTDSVLVPVFESQAEGVWTEEIDVGTGQRKRIVEGTGVSPSPDGTKIAYVRADSGGDKLWVRSLDTVGAVSDAKQVTDFPGGPSGASFCWAPDSRQIAFIIPPSAPHQSNGLAPMETETSTKETSTVVIYNPHKVDRDNIAQRTLSTTSAMPEIWTIDVRTNARKKVATTQDGPLGLIWMPDGMTLIYTSGRHAVAISVAAGTSHEFIDQDAADLSSDLAGLPSLDGKVAAFDYADYHGGYFHNWQVAIAPINGGPLRRLMTPFKSWALGWSKDGTHVFIERRNGVRDQILLMDKEGRLGNIVIQMDGTTEYGLMPAASTDGRLAWIEVDWQGRRLLRTASEEDPRARTVVDFTPGLDEFSLGETQPVYWISRDGVKGAGVLIKPVGYEPGRKYPLLIDLHGGPGGGVTPIGSFCISALEWQMWANKGYAVLVPEYRSSGFYGFDQILQERASRKIFDGDLDDILSGVDHMIRMGIADPNRMAVFGHSHGGAETNWIITHTHRFQAAITFEGFADLYADYGKTNPGDAPSTSTIFEWIFNGTPSTVPQAYLYNSAVYRAADVTTPTLFINSEQGINSPSMPFMYLALKEHGIDTQYLLYKDEGHDVSQAGNERDLLYWGVNWVDTHLGMPPTPDPQGVFNVADLSTSAGQETKR